MLFIGRAIQHLIADRSSEIEVKVVVPRHGDASMQLNAVVEGDGAPLTDMRLRYADGERSIRAVFLHGMSGVGGGGVRGLEPDAMVRHAMLERLVRADGPPERHPVFAVLHRQPKARVGDAVGL